MNFSGHHLSGTDLDEVEDMASKRLAETERLLVEAERDYDGITALRHLGRATDGGIVCARVEELRASVEHQQRVVRGLALLKEVKIRELRENEERKSKEEAQAREMEAERKALHDKLRTEIKALILDLRDNPLPGMSDPRLNKIAAFQRDYPQLKLEVEENIRKETENGKSRKSKAAA